MIVSLFFDISILFYKGTIVNTEIKVILFDKCFFAGNYTS